MRGPKMGFSVATQFLGIQSHTYPKVTPLACQAADTAPPPVPHSMPSRPRGEEPLCPQINGPLLIFSSSPRRRQVTGPGGRWGRLVQPHAGPLQQTLGCRHNVPDSPGGSSPGPAYPSWPTLGGGGTYCGGCGLAPSGWRRRISRPSLSTPGAGPESPSVRRRCQAVFPRVRPPPTRSPPRWRPRWSCRFYCRRRRCRHCALPASPAARMRSVTPPKRVRPGGAGGGKACGPFPGVFWWLLWLPGDRGKAG